MPDSKIMPRSQDHIKNRYSAYCLIFTHSFQHVKFTCPCNNPFCPFFQQFWCSFFSFGKYAVQLSQTDESKDVKKCKHLVTWSRLLAIDKN